MSWRCSRLSLAGQLLIYRHEPSCCEERSAAWMSLLRGRLQLLAAASFWARGLLLSTHPLADQIEFRHSAGYLDHAAFTVQFLGREPLWQFGNYDLSGGSDPGLSLRLIPVHGFSRLFQSPGGVPGGDRASGRRWGRS